MKRIKIIAVLLFLILGIIASAVYGQEIKQTIRGNIIDIASEQALPFASILIMNTTPQLGTTSDINGNFKIDHVPVGRYDIRVSFTGYETIILSEVLVSSAKEVVLNIQLRESVTMLSEVVIKPKAEKDKVINKMAIVSARKLSVEEASRYAGGFDDPARLASSFAGVASNVSTNGIIVRGNAPKGLLWRLEGVEIPNPNHFAEIHAFGSGGLTALSSNLMANSDFFTGAFPADYGNALSGVFDIRMRNGNNTKREHTFQIGLIGIDVATEGPFRKNGQSSYLINYRYSTFGLLKSILPEDADGTEYQDLSFKLNFPTKKAGVFSIWGIGAIDKSGSKAEKDQNDWEYEEDFQNIDSKQKMGALGLNHKIFLNKNTYLRSSLSATANSIKHEIDQGLGDGSFSDLLNIKSDTWTYSFNTLLNTKFGSRHTNRTGFIINNLYYDLLLEEAPLAGENLIRYADEKNHSYLLQSFSQSSILIGEKWKLNLGLHSQYFLLNDHYTIEPRLAIRWQFKQNQSLNFAYGKHSRLEKINFYLSKNNANEMLNKNLDFTKANHWVLAYDRLINDHLRFKAELYYQHLYDVPVDENGSFSFINLENDWFINEPLFNNGKGRNYGIDLTLERFLKNDWYYLITASVFNSEYYGGDKIWRDSRYNKNFVFNLLGGKEWKVGKNLRNLISLNGRISYQGGDRLTPYNKALSVIQQDVIEDDSRAFEEQKPNLFLLHFNLSFRKNKAKHSSVWSLKILNATSAKEHYGYRFNHLKNSVEAYEEALIIPNISYRIEF